MDTPVPSHVCVVGGGRWARVYLDVLDGLLPATTTISVHTQKGLAEMMGWVAARTGAKSGGRLFRVTAQPPAGQAGAVAIVANAAGDHAAAVWQLLDAGVPALVEKPVTPSWAETHRLVTEAADHGKLLAPSQVFLFTRYLENFAAKVRSAGSVMALSLEWTDPAGESRYGEAKRFDGGLPIQADLLPHIVPILSLVAPGPAELVRASVQRGGLSLSLTLLARGVSCQVHLERDGGARRRVLTAETTGGALRLDFSQEPGTILDRGKLQDADPEWGAGPRPLARMLQAFFAWAQGAADPRFDSALALQAARLSDLVAQNTAPGVRQQTA